MSLTRRSLIIGLAGAAFPASFASAAGVQIDAGLAFGSSWRITTDKETDLAALRPAIEAVITEIDIQMSPYRARSLLSVFNAARLREWQTMPPELCYVTSEALRMAGLTKGAFDPTVGPLVAKFGYGPIEGGLGSYADVDVAPTMLRKAVPELTLDLCGIAKGYALDRLAETLRRSGFANAMIEVGGEIKTLGTHPSGREWATAIADPTVGGFQGYRIVHPGAFALATSGHSVNGMDGPVSISHIINPRARRPAATDLASVSVLASTGIEADALATALCAAGWDEGIILARRLNISALFIARTDAGRSDTMTGRFADHVLA